MKTLLRSVLIIALLPIASAFAEDAFPMHFRDLFERGGKPSTTAKFFSGEKILITGYLAPPPTEESPFLVLVGAPTSFCPYCTSVDERDHLPYVLIYPDPPFDARSVGQRTRIVVSGELDAGVQNEKFYGLHNDLRVVSARVELDERNQNPVRKRLNPRKAATAPSPEAFAIDE